MRGSHTPISKITAVCCFMLVVTAGGATQLGAAVLCVGVDGHVDVEFTLAGCCASPPASLDQAAAVTLGPEAGSCGPCVDLDITSPPLKDEKTSYFTERTGFVISITPLPIGGGDTHRFIRVDRPLNHSGERTPHSTVVLLI